MGIKRVTSAEALEWLILVQHLAGATLIILGNVAAAWVCIILAAVYFRFKGWG